MTNFALATTTGPLTMTSREIADLVEARHNDVVATIERLFSKGLLRSSRKTRKEATGGRPIEVYDLIERDTHLVVAGYSDEHRARVIDRWQELEAKTRQPAIPQTLPEALRLAADLAEQNQQLAIERDEAVRTKAQIGSRREATAMAHTAAAKKEIARLKEELGFGAKFATIKAVESKTGISVGHRWRDLRKWCIDNNIDAPKVPDKTYGEVRSWPADAWRAIFDIDLPSIFKTSPAI